MATQTYMTAKLNLADGTIVYPQISLDNIVRSISDPTLVTVAELSGGKVPIAQLPTTLTVTDSNNAVPTTGAVYGALNTKQDTLVEGDNIIHIINGSTIMADITNLDVAGIDQTATNGVHLVLDGNTVSAAATFVTGETAGVLAGVSDGIALDNGVISVNPGSGLKIGVDTDAGKVVIDDASVEDTLKGGTVTEVEVLTQKWPKLDGYNDEVVTPGNMRGALSLGQAVDVTFTPNYSNVFTQASIDGGSTWVTLTTQNPVGSVLAPANLGPFSLKGTMAANMQIGFGSNLKYAAGLKYLYIVDVKASGVSKVYFTSYMTTTGTSKWAKGDDFVVNSGTYTRVWCVTSTPYQVLLVFSGTNGLAVQADIRNFRQYEVTALTEDAIEYLANYGVDPTTGIPSDTISPDSLFRCADIKNAVNVRDMYLIKNDMVCPWFPIINMGNSTAVTIGAGLAYKLTANDDQPHTLMIDTFPANAYGKDAKISIFVGQTGQITVKSPLILMQPFTANAVNNCTVRFRDGEARLYVDDTAYGYTVTITSGTGDGSLYYGIMGSTSAYITFSETTDDQECVISGTTMTANRTLNILGNGIDKTFIGGNDAIYNPFDDETKMLSVSDLSTDCGILTKSSLSLNNVRVDGATVINQFGTTQQSSIVGSQRKYTITGCTFSNMLCTDETGVGSWGLIGLYTADSASIMENTTISGNTNYYYVTFLRNGEAKDCIVTGNTATRNAVASAAFNHGYGTYTITNCYFEDNSPRALSIGGSTCTISGGTFATTRDSVTSLSTSVVVTTGDIHTNAMLDFQGKLIFDEGTIQSDLPSGATIGTGYITGAGNFDFVAGKSVTFKNISFKAINFPNVTQGLLNPGTSATYTKYDFDNIEITGCSVAAQRQFIWVRACCHARFKNVRISDSTNISTLGYGITGICEYDSNTVPTLAVNLWDGCSVFRNNNSVYRIDVPGELRTGYYVFTEGSTTTVSATGAGINSGVNPVRNHLLIVGDMNINTTDGTCTAVVGGTATIITGNNVTRVVSGIGTYMMANGDNDFEEPYLVTTSASTGDGSLGTGLASSKFVMVQSGVTASLASMVTATKKYILDTDCNIVFSGDFTVNAMTVDVDTKTIDLSGASTASCTSLTLSKGWTVNGPSGGPMLPAGGAMLGRGAAVKLNSNFCAAYSASPFNVDSVGLRDYYAASNGIIAAGNLRGSVFTNMDIRNLTGWSGWFVTDTAADNTQPFVRIGMFSVDMESSAINIVNCVQNNAGATLENCTFAKGFNLSTTGTNDQLVFSNGTTALRSTVVIGGTNSSATFQGGALYLQDNSNVNAVGLANGAVNCVINMPASFRIVSNRSRNNTAEAIGTFTYNLGYTFTADAIKNWGCIIKLSGFIPFAGAACSLSRSRITAPNLFGSGTATKLTISGYNTWDTVVNTSSDTGTNVTVELAANTTIDISNATAMSSTVFVISVQKLIVNSGCKLIDRNGTTRNLTAGQNYTTLKQDGTLV